MTPCTVGGGVFKVFFCFRSIRDLTGLVDHLYKMASQRFYFHPGFFGEKSSNLTTAIFFEMGLNYQLGSYKG